MTETLRLGTRTSRLAMWQAEHVASGLRAAWPDVEVELVPFVTKGDTTLDKPLPEIGGKGLFTAELEASLLDGRIDLAVHSLKDLPTEDPEGVMVGAILERADSRDAWICPGGHSLGDLPEGAVVGTSSPRRTAQLLRLRPDLTVRSIRGNVPTRIAKVHTEDYDAAVLAVAGLARLGRMGDAAEILPLGTMLPAPGQGAVAVQIRATDDRVRKRVAALDHAPTRRAVEAERHLLSALGGGCSAPVAALATETEDHLHLRGRVLATDGSLCIDVDETAPLHGADPAQLVGERAAAAALSRGASDLLP
ncbi:MAG: hydroxymethylbilane synthase [Bacteroidota bacterium]